MNCFLLAFTFSFPCKQSSLSQATLVSWTKGFSCTGVVGNDVVLLLQQAVNRRKVRADQNDAFQFNTFVSESTN